MAYSEFFKGGFSGKGFLDKGMDIIKFERSWPSIIDAFLDINKIEPKIRVPDILSRYVEYAVKVNMDTPNSPYNEIAMWVGIAKFADMILWKSSNPYDWVTARIKEYLIETFNPFKILPNTGNSGKHARSNIVKSLVCSTCRKNALVAKKLETEDSDKESCLGNTCSTSNHKKAIAESSMRSKLPMYCAVLSGFWYFAMLVFENLWL
ncbi:uncharacterized protein K444DRAFT_629593 [Hyaloscypha bicolor E]|uniref:Uncharacterized protein n=1 Tax=Hyaloscypha bicolor E TaxID=1095630 RepID=A0A2J6TAX4_9HELO|nr:uncharacterized protein K444DRAFT_629593 [Hyaloscypha bicolor E]PMD60175.1 hypothetical protein K444DRAFT_629593 [Hyaloscypha bicolor E]